jgi:hypothetical protein
LFNGVFPSAALDQHQGPGKNANNMTAHDVLERLFFDQPKFHFISNEAIQAVQIPLNKTGVKVKAGPTSYAVPREIIQYLATKIHSDHETIETGCGHTTVAFAALANHHTCVNPVGAEAQSIKDYLHKVDVPIEKITFLVEPSDTALPKLSADQRFDFAFIDGCHGYPFPALDWHYIDQRMKVGGIVGFDNTEIKAVRSHCEFLEANLAYRLIDQFSFVGGPYGANFYLKLEDQQREWIWQPYNYVRTPYSNPRGAHNHHQVGRWVKSPIRRLKKIVHKIFGSRT